MRSAGAAASPRGRAGGSFTKHWGTGISLQSPVSGAVIVYPSTPLELRWSPVAGARKYSVSPATDPGLGSLVPIGGSAGPAETNATALTPAVALAPGTYYWGVTPLDAEGNRGTPSQVASFVWSWPSATTPQLEDLNPAPEAYDPRYSWNAVPGAARYEVEVNSSVDFAPGSKVCCSGTTIATSLSPTHIWRTTSTTGASGHSTPTATPAAGTPAARSRRRSTRSLPAARSRDEHQERAPARQPRRSRHRHRRQ